MADVKPAVLIVDDIEANLVALEALLSNLPCEPVRAQSGNEALRQLLKREFAVMLLDVQMPEIDGYEVARYARENPRTSAVPILFLTASHNTEANMLKGYGSGAVDYLLKPLNSHVLLAKVHVFLELYLSRKRIADEVQAHQRTLGQLREANDALWHFSKAASHDLRAPLRAVRGLLELLSEEAHDGLSDKARDYVARISAASQRMDTLLNALLQYAGLQKAGAFTEVDCNAVIEQVRTDLAPALGAAGATLVAGTLPTLRGDGVRLYQLLMNLIGNAIKFRKPDVTLRVEVSAERSGGEWIFRVKDNGIGIAPRHQQAVFDEFKRLDTSSEGTGLGLTICRKIVETHGGRLWMESELGAGTTLLFALPA